MDKKVVIGLAVVLLSCGAMAVVFIMIASSSSSSRPGIKYPMDGLPELAPDLNNLVPWRPFNMESTLNVNFAKTFNMKSSCWQANYFFRVKYVDHVRSLGQQFNSIRMSAPPAELQKRCDETYAKWQATATQLAIAEFSKCPADAIITNRDESQKATVGQVLADMRAGKATFVM